MVELDLRVTSDFAEHDTAADFLRSCSSTPATAVNVSLVRVAASLMRVAIESGDLSGLRDLVTVVRERNVALDDIFAAARQVVIDSFATAPAAFVRSIWKRLLALCSELLPVPPFDASELDGLFTTPALVG